MTNLAPDEITQRWSDLINAADDLLANYPDCIAGIMPDQDHGLDRVLRLAERIAEANAVGPEG